MYYKELPWKYASDYVLILPDDTLYFKPETPIDIKKRFEKDWEEHLKRQAERHQKGDFTEMW